MRARTLALLAGLLTLLAGCLGSQELPGGGPGEGPGGPGEAPGWPPADEAEVRPGVTVVEGSCTSNFLFRTPDNRTLFLGTAAHCVDDRDRGDPVTVAGGAFQGRLAYSSFATMDRTGEAIEGNDFALIELPDEARPTVHPAMLSFGGPTDVADAVDPGDKVNAHGNSTLRPRAAPDEAGPREGYVTHHDEWTTGAYFDGPGVPGDSGSAVTTADGRALGTLVTVELAPQAGSNNVANLAATLAYANQHLDEPVELATWPTLADGNLPELGSSTGVQAVPQP